MKRIFLTEAYYAFFFWYAQINAVNAYVPYITMRSKDVQTEFVPMDLYTVQEFLKTTPFAGRRNGVP